MAVSYRTLILLAVTVAIIVLICVSESESRRSRSRSSISRSRYGTRNRYSYRSRYRSSYGGYRTSRSRIRTGGYRSSRIRVRQRVRIRHGSGGFTSSSWKAAVLAGSIYGGARYMQGSYYHRYPNRMPTICTNNFEIAPNGRIYGHFICPRETEPADYTWCCGEPYQQTCCAQSNYW